MLRTLIEAGANVLLINNAGVPGGHGVEEISETEWHRIIDTDLMSAWLGMKLDGRTTHDRLSWARLVGDGSYIFGHLFTR